MSDKVYITTSIPYVNGEPHIGFALEVVQADALARWNRLHGHDTYYLAGVDENAIKNVEAAEKKGVTPQKLVDELSKRFLALKDLLNLTYDGFIRTTSPKHKTGAQKLWKLCKEDIYLKKYEGLYCVGCETFYKDGQFPDNICPEHNRKLDRIEESNYFFRLLKYKSKIRDLIESDKLHIAPDFRRAEVLKMIDSDLEDFSVSRPVERTKGWGALVPDDPSQMMYVWFDALANYITALDFADEGELYKKYWLTNKNKIHVIGKNIIKFHAIYWIGMLLSAGVPTPDKIFVHGFINSEGKKMSKSLGNVINPFEAVEKYGVDAVRYYLLREIPSMDDGDFSYSRMDEIYKSELANELGNLVLRLTTLAEKDGLRVESKTDAFGKDLIKKYDAAVQNYEFNKAVELLWNEIKQLNKDINDFEPWTKKAEDRKRFLDDSIKKLHTLGFYLQPVIPGTSDKILKATEGVIHKIEPLFPRK